MKKVLLVVPVHNRPLEVKKLLTSLCKLKVVGIDLSVTLVDDGSNEDLYQVIKPFESRHLKISLIKNRVSFCSILF